jgi:hypothetical protein
MSATGSVVLADLLPTPRPLPKGWEKMKTREVEVAFYAHEIQPVSRQFFYTEEDAIAEIKRTLEGNGAVFNAVLFVPSGGAWKFMQFFWNGSCVLRTKLPIFLSRREAEKLYVEAGKLRGLPKELKILEED